MPRAPAADSQGRCVAESGWPTAAGFGCSAGLDSNSERAIASGGFVELARIPPTPTYRYRANKPILASGSGSLKLFW